MNSRWDTRGCHSRLASNEKPSSTRSEAVVEALPCLRRYARAVTGSADSGDRYVRQFLEVLLSDPHALAADCDPKLQSFMLFHEVCRGLDPAKDAVPAAGVGWIDRQFATLLPISREVLLLVYLEGFPVTQAARIVGIPESEARDHLVQARLAFHKSAPAAWSRTIASTISHFSVGSRADDPAAHEGSRAQRAAWKAAQRMMSSPSWGWPRTPDGPHQHDLPTDEQPGQGHGLPGWGHLQIREGGPMQQRQAVEAWESEGGATRRAVTATPCRDGDRSHIRTQYPIAASNRHKEPR